jgi:hypothetical protein
VHHNDQRKEDQKMHNSTITPVSNTIVNIPIWALKPIEGEYNDLQDTIISKSLFQTLSSEGRSGLFVNPISANIAATSDWANTTISIVRDGVNNLSPSEKTQILSTLISNSAQVVFTVGPASGSIIEVRYSVKGNIAVMDEYVAGSQTAFNLSQDPQQNQLPHVYVNSVYQSNSAFNFTSKVYGLVEMLSLLNSHTNRLSGLEVADYAEDLDLQKVISIGIALNTLANELQYDGENNNANNVLYCMSALFSSDILQSYQATMRNTIYPAVTNSVANASLIYSSLSGMVNGVTNIITSDVDFYRQAENQIKYHTLAAFMETVYAEPSGQFLIKYMIGTDRAKEILEYKDHDEEEEEY